MRSDEVTVWMTAESVCRLLSGGNASRGSVPVHAEPSYVAYVPLRIDWRLLDRRTFNSLECRWLRDKIKYACEGGILP
jgi:hypothetical protein